MKERVPSIALGSPPETGASSIWMPWEASSAAISLLAMGFSEVISIKVEPGCMWAATPFAPSMTCLTCGALGSMVSTRSQVEPMVGWSATLAPQASSSAAAAGEWLSTVTS